MGQSSIFEFMYDTYKITKPVRIIELFAGYGSQHLALTYLGVDVKGHKIVEWAVPSIQAYKDLHYGDVNTDHTKELTDDEIINELLNYGISANYNEPMTKAQIERKGSQWCRNVYNNIKNTNNLVNISNVKATDLEITETDKYDYIMTYSFPCQDLSLAGKRLGMDEDSGTRSGLLWEVERILKELNELGGGSLPQVLLMENVPQVMAQDNLQNMERWDAFLSKLGYKSYIKNLIATDYLIPQIRNRTFMISILGEYSYAFPNKLKKEYILKDFLEDGVDEKYFLSDKMVKFFEENSRANEIKGNGFRFKPHNENSKYSYTITTRAGGRMDDNFILVPEKTKKGYAEATNGDGVYINRPHQKRGVVQKDKIQTLKTTVDDIGDVVNNEKSDNLRIRKITPLEAFRLMGVRDDDYDKIADFSNSSLYKLAGNSIVIQVLMGIFGELLGIDYKKKIKESVKEIVWKLEIIGQERLSVY